MTHHAQSRYNEAENTYRRVLDLSRAVGNRSFQFEAISGLGRLHQTTGRPTDALACHAQALEIGQVAAQARAHDGLARAHRAQGDAAQARMHWQQALGTLSVLGLEHTEDGWANAADIRGLLSWLPASWREDAALPGEGRISAGGAI